MSTTDETVAKVVDGLDDNLEKVTDKEDNKPTEKPKDAEVDTPEEGKDPKQNDAEFTADDLDDPAAEPAKPVEQPADVDTSNLDSEAKYIVDNLPYMTVRVRDGESTKELQIKSWTQLPEDVTFANKRDELAFMNAMNAQENRALELQRQYKTNQQQEQSRDFEVRENNAIRDDIARLQKEGDLPKFKVKPDDAKFNEDSATQEVQKVLDFMSDRNKQYLDEYNQGRPYRHIGFEEAFHMYARKHPKAESEQAKEDKERRQVADKVGDSRGLTNRELKKPTVKPGTRVEQILDRIDAEW